MTRGILYGIGINDMSGVRSAPIRPFYQRWTSMLSRCYGKRNRSNVCYHEVVVCSEWLTFSKFKMWMDSQDWQGKELDKDLLVRGNREYSSRTCCFVPRQINSFLTTNKGKRGEYPLGVRYRRKNPDMVNELTNCYLSEISIRGKIKHLGYYSCKSEAHKAWQKEKLLLAEELLTKYKDNLIIEGLDRVVKDLKEDIYYGRETFNL